MKPNIKKLLIRNAPYLLFVYLFDKLGRAFEKAAEKPLPMESSLPERSAPGESRTACPTLSKRYTKSR